MDFIHQSYEPGETIAAIATPPGEGGVAIIRISGHSSRVIAAKVFSRPIHNFLTHTAHYGQLRNAQGEHVDDVLLFVMLGKRSYTGEDTVEIHCHGGSIITRRVLNVVLEAGARSARPGEFTFRAFVNGKIDLVQAEAVQELISAKNECALNVAEAHLKGSLSKKIQQFQKELTHVAAILEAWVDFPEEGLEFASMDEICEDLRRIVAEMEKLARTFHDGKIVHDGLSICLVGSPNVGKSSLMNALLDKERAIVSHLPGTTRDIVEDQLRLNGLHVKLMDTAGIRQAEDCIEQEGIRRSQEAMRQSDLILFVLDAQRGVREEEKSLMQQLPKEKTLAIWNKSDLPHQGLPILDFPQMVKVSAKERIGLEELHAAIDRLIWKEGPPSKEELVITAVRHREALLKAIEACHALLAGLRTGISPEFLTIEMRSSLQSLGLILGTNISEDILSAIFSTFCIGK
jgi:tRNA modification GTPase